MDISIFKKSGIDDFKLKPIKSDASFRKYFRVYIKNEKKELYNVEVPILWGGPVSEQQIYVLHSKEYKNETTESYKDFSITRDYKILFDIAENKGPKKSLIILGYSGWGDGQLEGEMEMDHWILSELDSQLIFEKESINKWLKAYENSFIRL